MRLLESFLTNATYSMIANALNIMISSATSILIPYIMGDKIDQYGFWQIYLFYVAYAGFFHFGLCDGALLIEGGKEYKDLNKSNYSFQYYFLLAGEMLISLFIVIVLICFHKTVDYIFIGFSFGIDLIICLPRLLLAYLLQASNRIKENSLMLIIERLSYLVFVLVLWGNRLSDYRLFIVSDLLCKAFALIYTVYQCRDIVFSKPAHFKEGINGVKESVAVGVKLMLASISSMIILGIVRFTIQQQWDVTTYGKISLTLSSTNLVLTFIGAMAIVLYPALRRVSSKHALALYPVIRDILMALLLATLIFCYPLQLVLIKILPQYEDSLTYLPILFPVCVYSAKVTMLVQTYMQVFRMEQKVLKVNLITIGIALFNTFISVYVLHSLTLAIFSILITSAFKSTFAEYIISKRMDMKIWKNVLFESLYVVIYVCISYFVGMKYGMLVAIPLYILYLFPKWKSIRNSMLIIKGT